MESPLPTQSCLSYRRVRSLMNAFEGEIFSRNLYKCKQVAYSVVVAYLLLYLLFILMCLLYFCILINYVNLPIIFVFGAFIYHFKDTISIVITIRIQSSEQNTIVVKSCLKI